MAADASRLRNWLNDAAMANGFHSVHVTTAALPETAGTHLRQFIARGFAGDMTWLADTVARRGQPRARRQPSGSEMTSNLACDLAMFSAAQSHAISPIVMRNL